jgi:hypothetical protein
MFDTRGASQTAETVRVNVFYVLFVKNDHHWVDGAVSHSEICRYRRSFMLRRVLNCYSFVSICSSSVFPSKREELAAMTRWSLRDRFGVTQDTERRFQPEAEPEAGPGQVAELAARQSFWPDICDQFGLHLLVLAEQLRASLDELEADEGDPERLRRLYQVDHAVTRMRRASRDLRTLAGRSEEELAGFTTSLLDVIRMAASAIERYTQVTVGRVTDLAVLGYAADDVGSLMAALLDNATRYSPGAVTVSCHLLEDGGVMFRVEDTGIGMGREQVNTLNATLAGPVPDVDERSGRHTGFPVVHRIARKHSIDVRLAARPQQRHRRDGDATAAPALRGPRGRGAGPARSSRAISAADRVPVGLDTRPAPPRAGPAAGLGTAGATRPGPGAQGTAVQGTAAQRPGVQATAGRAARRAAAKGAGQPARRRATAQEGARPGADTRAAGRGAPGLRRRAQRLLPWLGRRTEHRR